MILNEAPQDWLWFAWAGGALVGLFALERAFKHHWLVLLAFCVPVSASQVVVNNYSGTNVQVTVAGVAHVMPPGEHTLTTEFPVAVVDITLPSGITNSWDVSTFDQAMLDAFEFTVATDSSAFLWAFFSPGLAFGLGFGFGLTVFGFAWTLRIVRGISNHGAEL